jgi:D-3-phosphoglycerate dehydrogenase
MPDPVEPLIADLLEWIGSGRSHAEVMEAWRTSCPRLPVWEEAQLRGFVTRQRAAGGDEEITVTPAGRAFLSARARASQQR